MRVLLQRVRRAAVRVNERTVGQIGPGLLVFLGVESGDGPEDVAFNAAKTAELRIFPDSQHGMNASVEQVQGEVLVVSQFTLAAATRKGRRPSFSRAAAPELAEPLYDEFVSLLRQRGLTVATGVFRAMMDVELINDGPVTILLDPREAGEARDPR